MFEELIAKVRRVQAEFEFELSRTYDPYRLQNLCEKHKEAMLNFSIDAEIMVDELEGLDNE
jgi:hypothetical protein